MNAPMSDDFAVLLGEDLCRMVDNITEDTDRTQNQRF